MTIITTLPSGAVYEDYSQTQAEVAAANAEKAAANAAALEVAKANVIRPAPGLDLTGHTTVVGGVIVNGL